MKKFIIPCLSMACVVFVYFRSCKKNFSARELADKQPGGIFIAGTYYGATSLVDVTTKRLAVYGSLQLQASTVENLSVRGSAHIIDTTLKNHLDMYGACSMKNSVIDGAVVLYGALTAEKTIFHANITTTGIVHFFEVQAESLHFEKKVVEETVPYDIELRNNTHVDAITFIGVPGVIFCDGSSSVEHIENATLVRS